MYEGITKYISELEKAARFGELIVDRESAGTEDDPIQLPSVNYASMVDGLVMAVYAYVNEHEELKDYEIILHAAGLKWAADDLKNAHEENLSGQEVVAMIFAVIRADRFFEGTLLEFLENGCILRWVRRLKELDERRI